MRACSEIHHRNTDNDPERGEPRDGVLQKDGTLKPKKPGVVLI